MLPCTWKQGGSRFAALAWCLCACEPAIRAAPCPRARRDAAQVGLREVALSGLEDMGFVQALLDNLDTARWAGCWGGPSQGCPHSLAGGVPTLAPAAAIHTRPAVPCFQGPAARAVLGFHQRAPRGQGSASDGAGGRARGGIWQAGGSTIAGGAGWPPELHPYARRVPQVVLTPLCPAAVVEDLAHVCDVVVDMAQVGTGCWLVCRPLTRAVPPTAPLTAPSPTAPQHPRAGVQRCRRGPAAGPNRRAVQVDRRGDGMAAAARGAAPGRRPALSALRRACVTQPCSQHLSHKLFQLYHIFIICCKTAHAHTACQELEANTLNR